MNFETSISRHADMVQFEDTPTRSSFGLARIAIIALVLLTVGLLVWRMVSSAGEAPPKAATSQAPTVTVITAARTVVEGQVSANGSFAARREMPVGASGEGGTVTRVFVEPGSWVGQGQVLASIERSVQTQQNSQLVAQISVAQADARLAQSELNRATALAGRGFVSKADIERKTAQRDSANARVRVAQAQLAENSARIGRLDIRAPAAGLVLARNVEPGQVVGPGSGVLFRLAKGGEMEMKAELSEADLAKVALGQSVKVTPVGATQVFTGQIWQMPPVIDPTSRMGMVRVALRYDPALRPGGFASAEITSGTADVPLLPQSAVQSDQRGNYVYIVGANNKAERRAVKVGSVTDKGVAIMEGLSGTELVVASAGGFLNPGETIKPNRIKTPAN